MRKSIENPVNGCCRRNYTGGSNISRNPRDSVALDPILGTIYLPCSPNVHGRNSGFDWKKI
jgi:hypothetical protein